MSGVKVGLRTVVDDNTAPEPAGWRTTLHVHDVAVCGVVSSCTIVPAATELVEMVATSCMWVRRPTRTAEFEVSVM